jgi:hypothetical protein
MSTYAQRLARRRGLGWYGRRTETETPRRVLQRAGKVGFAVLRKAGKVVLVVVGLAVAGLAAGAIWLPRSVVASGMAVFDASNLVKNAETAMQAMKLVSQGKELFDLTTQVRRTIGDGQSFGAGGSDPFRAGMGRDAILGASQRFGQGGQVDLGRAFGLGQAASGSSGANFTDPGQAIQRFRAMLSDSEGAAGASGAGDLTRSRVSARANARDDAGGVALFVRNLVAIEYPTKIQSLANEARDASKSEGEGGNLRRQMANLAQLLLFVADQNSVKMGMAAADLQWRATESVASDKFMYLHRASDAQPSQQQQQKQSGAFE